MSMNSTEENQKNMRQRVHVLRLNAQRFKASAAGLRQRAFELEKQAAEHAFEGAILEYVTGMDKRPGADDPIRTIRQEWRRGLIVKSVLIDLSVPAMVVANYLVDRADMDRQVDLVTSELCTDTGIALTSLEAAVAELAAADMLKLHQSIDKRIRAEILSEAKAE